MRTFAIWRFLSPLKTGVFFDYNYGQAEGFYVISDRRRFACKCGCGFDAVDVDLYSELVAAESYFGQAIKVNSAARCETHNKFVGGVRSSLHLKAKAVDLSTPPGVGVDDFGDFFRLRHPTDCGIGRYTWGVHFDIRPYPVNWDRR